MATGTKTPQDNDFYDRVKDLHSRESVGSLAQDDQREAFENQFGGDNYRQTAETSGSGILADRAKQKEENPDYNGFYTGTGKIKDKKVYFNLKNLKKSSPLIGILITLLGLGGGIGIISSPGLLLFHVSANLLSKYDSQNTSMTLRMNKLIASKIAGDATSGSCKVVYIACRFTRPSNTLLRNLDANGIKALDSGGHPIPLSKSPFPNARPAAYEFTDSTGKKWPAIPAKQFSKELVDNPLFGAAFHRAYNPRFIGYADSIFKLIEVKFGFNKQNPAAEAKSPSEVSSDLEETALGSETEAKIAASEGEVASETLLRKLLGDQATKVVEALKNSSKGGAVQMIPGAICLASDVPRLITATVRAYQLAQLIRFGMAFMTTVDALKAGHGTQAEGTALGNMLTTVVAGKSAMSAFGMKYTLFGDTRTSDKSYLKFVPGGSVISAFSGVTAVTDSPITRNACSVATSPITGAAINGFLVANSGDTLGASALAAGLNLAGGWAVGQIIDVATPHAIDLAMSIFGGQVQQMMATLLGDITKNVSPPDYGNLIPSSVSLGMGQTSNAGANIPLTVPEAVAYNQATQQVQLAYAKEDRATLSPLDPMSTNTFLGSIVNQLLPYYGSFQTPSSILSTISSITGSTLGSLFQVNAASTGSDAYTLCNDPEIKNSNVAAGPFCNIIYGVPTQYLNLDPNAVLASLEASNDVDQKSGDPIPGSGLDDFIKLCTDGTTDNLESCKIDPSSQSPDDMQKIANYAVYEIDHRVQRTMDGEDPV